MTNYGPCQTWEPRWLCDISTESDAATGWAASFATEVVWALSGRQFGTCQVTLRPCRDQCFDGWPIPGWTEWLGDVQWPMPILSGGLWFNITCGGTCGGTCSCTELSSVLLPGPVVSIVSVRVDGVVVTGYQLYDDRRLIRTGGERWPACNDLNLPDTAPDTWSITATYGREVPEGGKWAVGELACELLRARRGDDCRLPRNVTQLARQGVTITLPDVSSLFKEGRTGLYATDLFLASVNPAHLHAPSRVYRVDGPTHSRPT